MRLNSTREIRQRLRTGLYISPANFNDGAKDPGRAGTIVYPRANQKLVAELRDIEAALVDREQFLLNLCASTSPDKLTKEFIEDALERHLHPEKYIEGGAGTAVRDFFGTFARFLKSRNISDVRRKNYKVLESHLRHFEAYRRKEAGKVYRLTLDGFSLDEVTRFEYFLRHEPEIAERYPTIYEKRQGDKKKPRLPESKGGNTVVTTFKRLRAFFNWCNAQELTDCKPFAKYEGVKSERYGTPYYITVDERNLIASHDLSAVPALEVQRDIFIFQCLIGCRVSDLIRLTPANIIKGAVEYIPAKTKAGRPEVVRVPLHPQALALVKKYAFETVDGRLFPFISPQKYNEALKAIFTACGITRAVTVLNPTTGQEEQRPLNEIASSHIARRTFVGNLYKQVRDPNLVGKLSGHKEGSRAFVRYRDIDEDMKRDLIKLL